MAEVVWSSRALADVDALYDYIARDSPRLARLFATRVLEAVDHLAEFPRAGRVVPERGRDDTREVLVQSYRVIYRVKRNQVRVLMVRHAARKP